MENSFSFLRLWVTQNVKENTTLSTSFFPLFSLGNVILIMVCLLLVCNFSPYVTCLSFKLNQNEFCKSILLTFNLLWTVDFVSNTKTENFMLFTDVICCHVFVSVVFLSLPFFFSCQFLSIHTHNGGRDSLKAFRTNQEDSVAEQVKTIKSSLPTPSCSHFKIQWRTVCHWTLQNAGARYLYLRYMAGLISEGLPGCIAYVLLYSCASIEISQTGVSE